MAAAFASVTTFAYRPAPPHIAQIPPPLAASATPTPMPLPHASTAAYRPDPPAPRSLRHAHTDAADLFPSLQADLAISCLPPCARLSLIGWASGVADGRDGPRESSPGELVCWAGC